MKGSKTIKEFMVIRKVCRCFRRCFFLPIKCPIRVVVIKINTLCQFSTSGYLTEIDLNVPTALCRFSNGYCLLKISEILSLGLPISNIR